MDKTLIIAAVCLASSVVSADDDAARKARRLTGQTLAVIDVVSEHSVAAPPRQELVRQIVAAVRREAKLDPPLDLGRRLSEMTDDAEFRELLQSEWKTVIDALAAEQESRQRMAEQIQKDANLDQPAGQGSLLSLIESDPESREELKTQLSKAVSSLSEKQPNREQSILAQAISSLLATAPGRNQLMQQEQHRVESQLAANRYVGIGIQIAGGGEKRPSMPKVFPGGPAHQAGALDGDVILEIDGVSTEGETLVEIVQRLRGHKGTDVEVVLQQKEEEPRTYTMTRGVVPIQHTHVERRQIGDATVDVIRFDTITTATVSDLRKIEAEWDTPPTAVLLDLQVANFDLHHATLLADALIDGGKLGTLRTSHGSREMTASREALFARTRLFVVVSPFTTGTTEWVAAALQDSGRATVIGQQTPGQPYVSEPFDVPGTDWVLLLSSGILERADGRRLIRTSLPVERQIAMLQHMPRANPAAAFKRTNQHDGGVVPVREIKPSSPKAGGRGPNPVPTRGIPVDDALKAISSLLDSQDDPPETE